LLHLFRCHLSIALALRVRIFVYNGRDDEELASHSARAMVFDANTTLPVVGVRVTENINWTNNSGVEFPPLMAPTILSGSPNASLLL
jgi:hypothetical protein